ncbi:MAG: hypothetical protein ACK4IY_01490 [Chitinophagales bacterium]
MKKSVFVFALALLVMTGNVFSQSKGAAEKTTTTQQNQGNSADKANKKEKNQSATKNPSAKQKGASRDDDQRSASEKAKDATNKMTSELGLNAQQQQQALQANNKYFNALEELKRSSTEADKAQMQSRKDQLNNQRMAEFKTFLTSEQYAKLESRGGGSGDGASTSKADKKAKADSMTPEEKERMREEKSNRKQKGSN